MDRQALLCRFQQGRCTSSGRQGFGHRIYDRHTIRAQIWSRPECVRAGRAEGRGRPADFPGRSPGTARAAWCRSYRIMPRRPHAPACGPVGEQCAVHRIHLRKPCRHCNSKDLFAVSYGPFPMFQAPGHCPSFHAWRPAAQPEAQSGAACRVSLQASLFLQSRQKSAGGVPNALCPLCYVVAQHQQLPGFLVVRHSVTPLGVTEQVTVVHAAHLFRVVV